MKEKEQQKGITLVALVITIILLLILAGITINLTLGEHGIFTTARKSAWNYTIAQQEEEKALQNLTKNVDKILGNEDPNEQAHIFLYEEDTGIITGLKPEYITYIEDYSDTSKKIASLSNVKIAGYAPRYRYLADELNGTLKIPNKIDNTNITGIDGWTFSDIVNLKTVKIAGGVSYIGDYAFYCCKNLKSVTIADGVREIGNDCFRIM